MQVGLQVETQRRLAAIEVVALGMRFFIVQSGKVKRAFSVESDCATSSRYCCQLRRCQNSMPGPTKYRPHC